MSFAEKGAVSDIDPAFFIGYLHRQKATGTLKFEDTSIQRAVYFREGRVLFSSSNAAEDQLGAILVAAGKISQEQFDAMVAGLEPKQSIAAALAQGGHVSQRDIGDAARRKVEQIVGACCAQSTGQFEFEDGVLPKGALDLKLTTERVLVSAFEVLEPSGFLSRILKSPMAVLAQAEVEPADPDLARLREALDGVSSLADIGAKVGLPLAATEARAAVLVVLGAASVVTSQIEEMALPDTGEASLAYENPVSEDEPIEAETIAFAPGPGDAETIAFGETAASVGSGLGPDSTLSMAPSPGGLLDGSADATLVLGAQGGLPAPSSPSQSGAMRAGGGKRERASTQDLDAVKELLGAPSPEKARPGAASMPAKQWEPMLSTQGRTTRERGASGVLKSPIFKSVAAVVLLALVIGGGWLAYTLQSGPRAVAPPPLPSPTQAVSAPSPAPETGTSPVPPASTSTKPLPAPTMAASRPSPAPAVSVSPKAVEKPVTAPAPRSTPVPPVTAQALPAGQPAKGSGYEALKAGRLADAETAFESAARTRSSEFSVQLLVACSPQTVEKAVQNDPSAEVFILPATISGKACHRLMRGFFKTLDEATQAVSALPGYYVAEGAKPRAIPVKSVLR